MPVVIRGDKELKAKLARITDPRRLEPVMKAATLHVVRTISPYPRKTKANSSAEPRWYERGYGPKWRRKDGTVRGIQSSEQLGQRWATRVRVTGYRVVGVIGNNASYAEYVHSYKKQSNAMRRIGWKTDRRAIREAKPVILRFFSQQIDRLLK